MCNSFLRFYHCNLPSLCDFYIQYAKNYILLLIGLSLTGILFSQTNSNFTETHKQLPSLQFVPVLINIEEILTAYEQDSNINPIYIYRDQSTGSQITTQKFNRAYPFENCGLAIVQFENEDVLSVINTKGERIFKLSNPADHLRIIGNGFIEVQNNNLLADESHYDLYLKGTRILSGMHHEFHEIRGSALIMNYNYNLDFAQNQSILIDSTGHVIAKNLIYKSDRNGFLYFVNEIKKGGKSKLEIYNSLGNTIFTSPDLDFNLENYDYFPKNIQTIQTEFNQKFHFFILGNEKNPKKNRFVAISENGKIINETPGVVEYQIKKDWVKLSLFNKNEEDNIALFHPHKGYFPKILLGSFLKNQEKPCFIYQNRNKEICLYNDIKSILLPHKKFNYSRLIQLGNGAFLEIDNNGKNTAATQFWLDFETEKSVPVKTFKYDTRKKQCVYIDLQSSKLVCSGTSSHIFTSKDLGVPIEYCRIAHCTKNYFSLEINDILYFFDYQGRSINEHIAESEIWELDSEIDLEIEPALIYRLSNSKHLKIVGIPNHEFKKTKDALAPTGNILSQDASNHIALIPLGNGSHSNEIQPQFITIDSIFDYQFYHPLIDDAGEFDYQELNLDAAKLNFDIIYNDRLRKFWIYYKGNQIKQGSYAGLFLNNCVSRFKGMNITSLFNNDEIPFIFNTGKEVYITKKGPHGSMTMDSIDSQFTQFRTAKNLLYNRSITREESSSVNLYSYLYKLEEIQYNSDKAFEYLDELIWVNTDSGRMGIWNFKSKEWLVDPNLGSIVGVFASDNLILLTEKQSNTQIIKSIVGKPLITFDSNTALNIFDEGEEMGLFIETKTSNSENRDSVFFQTYRIDNQYSVRTHFPNYNSLPDNLKNILMLNSDEGFNQNIHQGLFSISLNFFDEIPIYFERNGTLLLEFNR